MQGHATRRVANTRHAPAYVRTLAQYSMFVLLVLSDGYRASSCVCVKLLHPFSYSVECLIPVALAFLSDFIVHKLQSGILLAPHELCFSSVNHLQEVALSESFW